MQNDKKHIAKRKKDKGLWLYLDSIGILENGSNAQIKEAKKKYRAKYLLDFKRKQRAEKKEFSVCFSKENGEFKKIERSAMEHKKTVPAFVKAAAFAYIGKTYVVPNREQIARLEGVLAQCFNEIQIFAKANKTLYWQQFDNMRNRIEKLEGEVNEVLRQPLSVEDYVLKEVNKNPLLAKALIEILSSHGHYQNQDKE